MRSQSKFLGERLVVGLGHRLNPRPIATVLVVLVLMPLQMAVGQNLVGVAFVVAQRPVVPLVVRPELLVLLTLLPLVGVGYPPLLHKVVPQPQKIGKVV